MIAKHISKIILALSLFITPFTVRPASFLSERAKSSRAMEQWVDSVFNTLTLEERIGQFFVPIVDLGTTESNQSRIKRLVEEYKIGGILFHKGKVSSQIELTRLAQSLAKVPLMITLDGEWGLSMRLENTTRFPKNIALGAIQDSTLLYEYGKELGRQCKEMGIHVNFAPVLDINTNANNPVIGTRSFGNDRTIVARNSIMYALGLESTGVLSVAKHFPGHGDTSVDSHKALPIVAHSKARLDSVELYPFKEYINRGLSGMLTAHIAVPVIDEKDDIPASMSKRIVTDLLQGELGFDGLIFTDALAMKGATRDSNPALRAFVAGNDVLLGSLNVESDIKMFVEEAERGTFSVREIEQRCKKILRYKFAFGLYNKQSIQPKRSPALQELHSEVLNKKLTSATITLTKNNDNLLPVKFGNNKMATVSFGEQNANVNTFQNTLKLYGRVDHYRVSSDFNKTKSADLIKKLKGYNVVIISVHGTKNVQWETITAIARQQDCILTLFTSPFAKMPSLKQTEKECKAILLAYENTPLTQECAAMAVMGGEEISGKLPVDFLEWRVNHGISIPKSRLGYDLPESVGMDGKVLNEIDKIANDAIKQKAFPGCQVLVAKDGKVIFNRSYGFFDYSNTHRVVYDDIYDIASMTKTLGTLPMIIQLIDDKKLNLNDTLGKHLPLFKGTDKEKITIREMLFHESGLNNITASAEIILDRESLDGPLYSRTRTIKHRIKVGERLWANENVKRKPHLVSSTRNIEHPVKVADRMFISASVTDTILAKIVDMNLRANKRYLYSDLNFILLKLIAEELNGKTADNILRTQLLDPLGCDNTFVNPTNSFSKTKIAPTENDEFFRRQLLVGYVHDELSALLGGYGGSAGLFGNANDIAKICQLYLQDGKYGPEEIFSKSTTRIFTQTRSNRSRRGLGFDKPDPVQPPKTLSELAPKSVYGHTGFTGTCFWIDPENNIIFIFLSNRVYPTRLNNKLTSLNVRKDIHSAIYKSLK